MYYNYGKLLLVAICGIWS